MSLFKTSSIALILSACALLTSATSAYAQDEIVIYRSLQADRCTSYFQASSFEYYDEELEELVTVPTSGGRSKFSGKQTSYIIFNKTTGDFREIVYENFVTRDENGTRVRVKQFHNTGSFPDGSFGITPASLFETDDEARRNFLVLSLKGTGNGTNNFFSQDSETGAVDAFTSVETLVGVVGLRKIRTVAGVVVCEVPALFTGKVVQENQFPSFFDDSITRTFCLGNKAVRLDVARTREFLNSEVLGFEGAEAAIIAHLELKGYIEQTFN